MNLPDKKDEENKFDLSEQEAILYNALKKKDVLVAAKIILNITKNLPADQLKEYSCPPLNSYEIECDELSIKIILFRDINQILEKILKMALAEHLSNHGFSIISKKRYETGKYPIFSEDIAKKYGMKFIGVDLEYSGCDFTIEGEFTGRLAEVFLELECDPFFTISSPNDMGEDEEKIKHENCIDGFNINIFNISLEKLKSVKKDIEQYYAIVLLKNSEMKRP